MKNFLYAILAIVLGVVAYYFVSHKGMFAMEDPIVIHSETFGTKGNPAVLLNANFGMPGLVYSDEFCQTLADKGFFVIRYDYRNTGKSTYVDFEKRPFKVDDLAKDAVKVLNEHQVGKASFVGFSLGGEVAMFVAAEHPTMVNSLVLIGATRDYRPLYSAYNGSPNESTLSSPETKFVEWMNRAVDHETLSLEQQEEDFVQTSRIMDGSVNGDFEEGYFRQLFKNIVAYSGGKYPYNSRYAHSLAIQSSLKKQLEVPSRIADIPTLIIAGKVDPITQEDHALDLQNSIKNSDLIIWHDFGHAISPRHYDKMLNTIAGFIKK